MRILVDLDSIVADFFGGLWPVYAARTGRKDIGTAQVTSWDFAGVPHVDVIKEIFYTPGFFRGLSPIPGAITALEVLQHMGHELFIVSAHCTDHSAAEKLAWIKEHLPFIDKEHVVITKAKHIFRADIIIDDSPDNCVRFLAENPKATALTIAYPYNDHPVYKRRCQGFDAPAVAWGELVGRVAAIEGVAKAREACYEALVNEYVVEVEDALP